MARLDIWLSKHGMAPSRQRAQGLIRNGQIFVNGVVCTKPAYGVAEGDQVTMEGEDLPFVGRGGLKLEHAVQAAGLQLDGLVCMDIGASTGGFTDCMLQHGARRVYAVDVGHGQLAESLRQDSRVVNWEGTDIRSVTPAQLPEPVDFFPSMFLYLSDPCAGRLRQHFWRTAEKRRFSSSLSLRRDGRTSGKTVWSPRRVSIRMCW